ncbi:MAG: hypothetical protein IJU95_01990 [Treponema sp.]|nr:hypothetical protein [Treponema sp.]
MIMEEDNMKCFGKKSFYSSLVLMAGLCMAASAASVKQIPANEGIKEVSVNSDLFIDGVKASSITLSYTKNILPSSVTIDDYRVDGRVIKEVSVKGKDVTLTLDCSNKMESEPDWNSLEDLPYETKLTVTQTGEVLSSNSKTAFIGSYSVITPNISSPELVEKFAEKSFIYNKTNLKFRYNIYMPENYLSGWNYPLVVFIGDDHVVSDAPKAVLLQGQGGTIWASGQEQSKHKCIVIAIQYLRSNEQEHGKLVAEDGSVTEAISAIKELIDSIGKSNRVDGGRVYGVGQGEGANALMTLAENYPDLFAGMLLVAPQKQVANPSKLAGQKIWLQVSEGDSAAYSRANLLTDAWESAGAQVAYGKWKAGEDAKLSESAAKTIIAQKAPINCGIFEGGNHPYTWTRTYEIESIRDWLFRQHR